jgi:hypothetical protein
MSWTSEPREFAAGVSFRSFCKVLMSGCCILFPIVSRCNQKLPFHTPKPRPELAHHTKAETSALVRYDSYFRNSVSPVWIIQLWIPTGHLFAAGLAVISSMETRLFHTASQVLEHPHGPHLCHLRTHTGLWPYRALGLSRPCRVADI